MLLEKLAAPVPLPRLPLVRFRAARAQRPGHPVLMRQKHTPPPARQPRAWRTKHRGRIPLPPHRGGAGVACGGGVRLALLVAAKPSVTAPAAGPVSAAAARAGDGEAAEQWAAARLPPALAACHRLMLLTSPIPSSRRGFADRYAPGGSAAALWAAAVGGEKKSCGAGIKYLIK
jgi:hypothetical protein